MHEVRATVPVEHSAAVARIAIAVGIPRVSVYDIFVHGPERRKHVVSVETSTPKARAFINGILDSPLFDLKDYSISSRELRALITDDSLADLTKPVVEPGADVIQDLWQMSQVTPSYIGRAAGGAVLLAQGVIQNSPIAIVVAALFLPFLPQVLAVGFGAWCGDRPLVRQGVAALATSTVLAYFAGLLVAAIIGGPIGFQDFKGPLPSLAISMVIGVAAGLSTADDAGRRDLIGVAAAVQFSIFPVWLGAATVIGMPSPHVLVSRLESFVINLIVISAAAVAAYAMVGLRRQELRRFIGAHRKPGDARGTIE